MSCDDNYQVQNIYQYCRKTYKKNYAEAQDETNNFVQTTNNMETDISPRSDENIFDTPICSCDLDQEGEVADILHKKCPVILLAQKQLQKLLEGTDKLLSEHSDETYCRSLRNFINISKEIFQNKCACALSALVIVSFLCGLLLGAASCGMHLRQFNSPILIAIESYFAPDTYDRLEETFRSIT